MSNVKVYSLIHRVTLADQLDLPEPTKSEVRGQYRVLLETPFPAEGISYFFAFYMPKAYFEANRINNRFIEEITMEHMMYRRQHAIPRER